MTTQGTDAVSPALLHAWLAGRSLARGVPAPVADRGGYRVDTGSDSEHCRWVFAAPSPNLSALAREIDQPGRLIKLCGKDEALRELLPDSWQLHALAFFMQSGSWPAARALPPGYRCETSVVGSVAHVAVFGDDGSLAASGYAAETGAAFVFDRIVTAPSHRRKGLGAGVMAALRATRTRPDVPELLVATDEGRCLYQRLGWRVLSPYATAEFAA
jgi:GNAT superfamily N-acetyltransferase